MRRSVAHVWALTVLVADPGWWVYGLGTVGNERITLAVLGAVLGGFLGWGLMLVGEGLGPAEDDGWIAAQILEDPPGRPMPSHW